MSTAYERAGAFLAILGVLSVGIAGCGEENPIESQSYIDGVPLAVGNRWTYEISSLHPSGEIAHKQAYTVEILRDTTVDGEHWFIVGSLNAAWTNREDGFWIWPSPGGNRETAYRLLEYAADAGHTYEITALDLHRTATVTSVDEAVTLPHGTYRCLKYQIADREGTPVLSIYLSPGLGWVRSEVYAETADGGTYVAQVQELVNTTLN